MVAGLPNAEKLAIPFIESHRQPLGPPTAAFPVVLTPHVPVLTGAIGRRVRHRLTAAALRMPFAPATRVIRTELLGLPVRPDPRRDPRCGMPSTSAEPEEQSAAVVTFEAVALEFVDRLVKPNPETKRKYLERLRVHVFPVIGERPIFEITRREMRRWQ